MNEDDEFPNAICFSCELNVEFFTNLKEDYIQNDKNVRQKLTESLNIKVEEVIFDDLDCNNEKSNRNEVRNKLNDVDSKQFNPSKILDHGFSSMENKLKITGSLIYYENKIASVINKKIYIAD